MRLIIPRIFAIVVHASFASALSDLSQSSDAGRDDRRGTTPSLPAIAFRTECQAENFTCSSKCQGTSGARHSEFRDGEFSTGTKGNFQPGIDNTTRLEFFPCISTDSA